MVKVKDIMKKNVVTADPGLNMADVAKIMTNNRVGSVVVMKREMPTGIVTESDIVTMVANGKNLKSVRVKDVPKRRRGFVYAGPNESVQAVTRKMIKNGVKRIPIIEKGRLLGMVSDKEILIVSPEMINILSEKLKMRVERVADPTREISGICENCEAYSDHLVNQNGRWICESCK
ncbi:MAG: CBS domain-containing protein [Candidatus Aenigmarchaeota archaeon]|nr:CBS domain-containing protein [Candidatus Aenigmarchaeota archaeon]